MSMIIKLSYFLQTKIDWFKII